MNFNELIITISGITVTGIIGFIGRKVNQFLSEKNLDNKTKKLLSEFRELVKSSVMATYQIYVKSLKEDNRFDLENQKNALNNAKSFIINNLSNKTVLFLKSLTPSLDKFIEMQIEKTIYELKYDANIRLEE